MGAGGGIRPSWGPRAPSGGSEAALAGRAGAEDGTRRALGLALSLDCAAPARPAWPQVPWMRPPRVPRPPSVPPRSPSARKRQPLLARVPAPGAVLLGRAPPHLGEAARPLGRDGATGKRKTSRGIEPLRTGPRVVGACVQ